MSHQSVRVAGFGRPVLCCAAFCRQQSSIAIAIAIAIASAVATAQGHKSWPKGATKVVYILQLHCWSRASLGRVSKAAIQKDNNTKLAFKKNINVSFFSTFSPCFFFGIPSFALANRHVANLWL